MITLQMNIESYVIKGAYKILFGSLCYVCVPVFRALFLSKSFCWNMHIPFAICMQMQFNRTESCTLNTYFLIAKAMKTVKVTLEFA